jgi:hypothetical protein
MPLTDSERSRIRSLATSRWRGSPFTPFEDVAADVARQVKHVQVRGHIEKADASTQADYFDVAAAVATTRADLLRSGKLKGLVHELRALVGP